ncbi:hypothetical protein [Streptomyces sp. NPDC060002]|uniref:hypothetical protein n=1 Tax=Streptomyces sp. NPDC060002 TaxID=3347033 RepID=UPI0036C69AC1
MATDQQESRLWQERRIAYAAFMDAEMDATGKIDWAWLVNVRQPLPDEGGDHPLRQEATQALELASEAIDKVARQSQEVLLITSSDAVQQAVRTYLAAMSSNTLLTARADSQEGSAERQALVQQLTLGHHQFVAAAREELRIRPGRVGAA